MAICPPQDSSGDPELQPAKSPTVAGQESLHAGLMGHKAQTGLEF